MTTSELIRSIADRGAVHLGRITVADTDGRTASAEVGGRMHTGIVIPPGTAILPGESHLVLVDANEAVIITHGSSGASGFLPVTGGSIAGTLVVSGAITASGGISIPAGKALLLGADASSPTEAVRKSQLDEATSTLGSTITSGLSGKEPLGAASSAVSSHVAALPHVALSTTAASALGTAAVGTGTTSARSDHVHAMPTAAQVGADATGTASAAITAHNAAQPHVALSSTTPSALGTAAVGTGTTSARADHVHKLPTAGDVGAAAAVHTHTTANVTGLDTALSGKAASVHTHMKSQVTDFAHTHPISETTGLQTALDAKVAKAGDTMTGGLTISSGTSGVIIAPWADASAGAVFTPVVSGVSQSTRRLYYSPASGERWVVENGLVTGTLYTSGVATLNAGANVAGLNVTSGNFTVTAGATSLTSNTTSSALIVKAGPSATFAQEWQSSAGTRVADLRQDGSAWFGPVAYVSGAAADNRGFYITTNRVGRWFMMAQGAETGADAGTNFALIRYADGGAGSTVLAASRATGLVTLYNGLSVNGSGVAVNSGGLTVSSGTTAVKVLTALDVLSTTVTSTSTGTFDGVGVGYSGPAHGVSINIPASEIGGFARALQIKNSSGTALGGFGFVGGTTDGVHSISEMFIGTAYTDANRFRITPAGVATFGNTLTVTNGLTANGGIIVPQTTNGKGILWGSGAGNYANIWTEHGSAALVMASMLKPIPGKAGFASSTGAGNYGRQAIRMNGNNGIEFFSEAQTTTAADTEMTLTRRLLIAPTAITASVPTTFSSTLTVNGSGNSAIIVQRADGQYGGLRIGPWGDTTAGGYIIPTISGVDQSGKRIIYQTGPAKWTVEGGLISEGNLSVSSGGLIVTSGGATISAGGLSVTGGITAPNGNSIGNLTWGTSGLILDGSTTRIRVDNGIAAYTTGTLTNATLHLNSGTGGPVNISGTGATTHIGGLLTVGGAATLNSTLAVTGTTTLTGLLTANGGIVVPAGKTVAANGGLTATTGSFSGLLTANAGVTVASGQTIILTSEGTAANHAVRKSQLTSTNITHNTNSTVSAELETLGQQIGVLQGDMALIGYYNATSSTIEWLTGYGASRKKKDGITALFKEKDPLPVVSADDFPLDVNGQAVYTEYFLVISEGLVQAKAVDGNTTQGWGTVTTDPTTDNVTSVSATSGTLSFPGDYVPERLQLGDWLMPLPKAPTTQRTYVDNSWALLAYSSRIISAQEVSFQQYSQMNAEEGTLGIYSSNVQDAIVEVYAESARFDHTHDEYLNKTDGGVIKGELTLDATLTYLPESLPQPGMFLTNTGSGKVGWTNLSKGAYSTTYLGPESLTAKEVADLGRDGPNLAVNALPAGSLYAAGYALPFHYQMSTTSSQERLFIQKSSPASPSTTTCTIAAANGSATAGIPGHGFTVGEWVMFPGNSTLDASNLRGYSNVLSSGIFKVTSTTTSSITCEVPDYANITGTLTFPTNTSFTAAWQPFNVQERAKIEIDTTMVVSARGNIAGLNLYPGTSATNTMYVGIFCYSHERERWYSTGHGYARLGNSTASAQTQSGSGYMENTVNLEPGEYSFQVWGYMNTGGGIPWTTDPRYSTSTAWSASIIVQGWPAVTNLTPLGGPWSVS